MILILVAREGGFLCTEFRLVFVSSTPIVHFYYNPEGLVDTASRISCFVI